MTNLVDLDKRIAAQKERLDSRGDLSVACEHEWGTAYKSSSGRKVCVKCGHVTEKPFDTLGAGER